MEQIALFILLIFSIVITLNYIEQKKINRIFFTFLLREQEIDKLKDLIDILYVGDATWIKKYFKKHYSNMIDVDTSHIFKNITNK